jgi:cystathionine beta-lyase/cystathionine gamma-synthase
MTSHDFRTRAIAGPEVDGAAQRPVGLPICQTTTFVMDDALESAMAGGDYRSQYMYTRHANPTVDALQKQLADLHGAPDAVCFASGMAAISSAFVALVPPGGGVVADTRLYGATTTYLSRYLAEMGRQIRFAPLDDDDALVRALDSLDDPRVVYGETLANPLVQVLPLPRVAERAHARGALLAVDNTFASPFLSRPLAHGADVVIESLSKSIAGHSDVHGGLVAGASELVEPVWHAMVHLGGCIDPHAAWLVWRGLKTLPVRIEAAQRNAVAIARSLRELPGVERVYFPDREALDAPWLDGPGAMLSFVVPGGDEAAHRVMHALSVVTAATSLGGVESLVSLPYNTSHRTEEARRNVGLLPGTIRLSVGCESVDDLIADLHRAIGPGTS